MAPSASICTMFSYVPCARHVYSQMTSWDDVYAWSELSASAAAATAWFVHKPFLKMRDWPDSLRSITFFLSESSVLKLPVEGGAPSPNTLTEVGPHLSQTFHVRYFAFTRGHRKSSQKPSETNKISFTWNPSLPPKRTKVRTPGFNSLTNVYTKHHLKPKVRFFKNPALPHEFCSFHWTSANLNCDGPLLFCLCSIPPQHHHMHVNPQQSVRHWKLWRLIISQVSFKTEVL